MAIRATGLYENSDSYRDGVSVERYGFNPTVAFRLGPNTTLRGSYEYFTTSESPIEASRRSTDDRS